MKFGTLIFLLYVAWHIISGLIAQAEKKKKQESQIELTSKRKAIGDSYQPTQIESLSPRQQLNPGSSRPRSRTEELAARRQAQLEELRLRRAGRSTRSRGQTQIRVGTPPSAPVTGIQAPSTVRSSKTIKLRKADLKSIHRQQELQKQQNAELERQKLEQTRAASVAEGHRQAAKEAHMRAERESFHHKAEEELLKPLGQRASVSAYDIRTKSEGVSRNQIKARLSRRATLRELFLLKELIDPPVALRSSEL